MMLFHMKSEKDSFHWTEYYTIATIFAMFIEDLRKVSRTFPIIVFFSYQSDYNVVVVRRRLLHTNVRKMAFVERMDATRIYDAIYSFWHWHWISLPLQNST